MSSYRLTTSTFSDRSGSTVDIVGMRYTKYENRDDFFGMITLQISTTDYFVKLIF